MPRRNTLVLTLHSADGEENYPGNLEVVATYTVVEETLHLRLEAYADAATIVNQFLQLLMPWQALPRRT